MIKRHPERKGLARLYGAAKPTKLSAFVALFAGVLIWRRKHSHEEAATV